MAAKERGGVFFALDCKSGKGKRNKTDRNMI